MVSRVRVAVAALTFVLVGVAPASAASTTWRQVNVPSSPGRGYGVPTCLDATHCWVPDNTRGVAGILVTANAGRNWFTSSLPTRVTVIDAVACSSANVCAAVGFDAGPQGIPRAVALRSSNGGRQWRLATLPAAFAPTAGTWTRLDTLSCRANGRCVATGAGPAPPTPPVSCGSGCTYTPGGSQRAIALWALTSSDGGATWRASTVENSLPDEAYQIVCASATTCAGVGFGFGPCPPGQRCGAHGLAFFDDAARWRLVAVPTGIFSVNSLSCPTTSRCLAVGSTGDAQTGHGVVLRSFDGGRSWQRLVAPAGSNALTSIACVSTSTCVATGGLDTPHYVQPTVFLTTNAGATWSDQAVPAAEFTGAVACPNVSFCLMSASVSLGSTARGLLLRGSA